jgi:enoyl-CoA hydratase/carnithine racemase
VTSDTSDLMEYENDGGIVVIRFNRPDRLNAFNDEMVRALGGALQRFDADPEARVAVLCGNGRAFSSGADVHQRQLRPREELATLGGPEGAGARAGDLFVNSVNWKPVIAAPHGYVLGLAVGIVLESDLIVVAEGTRFQITETSRGIGGGRYWGLLQFRGAGTFGTEVALTGRWFTAEEAYAAGAVDRLVPEAELLPSALELARQVDGNPPLSVRATVRTRRWYLEQLVREIRMMNAPLKLHLTGDFREAAAAFAEKRPPRPFTGA